MTIASCGNPGSEEMLRKYTAKRAASLSACTSACKAEEKTYGKDEAEEKK
jgi:hypothetical protein